MADKEYIQIARPRRRSGFLAATATRSSLWLGKDHLLCVETNGYTETYKRFYFRDIQAFTGLQTRRRAGFFCLLSLPVLLCIVVFIAGAIEISGRGINSSDYVGIYWWGLALVVFCVPLIVNQLRGPGCKCSIRSAVQEEEIPAFKRIKQVDKIMARVRPLITAAQGTVTREDIPARFRELATQNQPRLVVDDPLLPPRIVN